MDDLYDEVNFHLLVRVLVNQIRLLNRPDEAPRLVAVPPDAVYMPVKEDPQ